MKKILEEQLEIIASHELYMEALNTIFAEQVEKERPAIGSGDNNTLLGEKYRAFKQANQIIANTLLAIGNYKKEPKNPPSFDKSK